MKMGKALGPDGYSFLYYKSFGDLLTPPVDTLRAHITALLKEGKDPLHCLRTVGQFFS